MRPTYLHCLLKRLAALLGFALLASCQSLPAQVDDGSPQILIRNVTVIAMDRPGSTPAQDVLIEGGRILAVGRTGSVRHRPAAELVDGRGKYLIPGLWDMHVHALVGESGNAQNLRRYLAWGVVGVRDLGSTLDRLQRLRQERAADPNLPEFVGSGPLLDGPRQRWMQQMALPLDTVDAARDAAIVLADARVDFLKIYNNLSPEQYAAVVAVARRRGVPFAGHVPFQLTVEQVSAAGQSSIEHAGVQLVADCIPHGRRAIPAEINAWVARGYRGRFEERSRWWAQREIGGCRALYQRMAARRTWVTPTLTNELAGGRWTPEQDIAALPAEQMRACRSNLEGIAAASPALRSDWESQLLALVGELHRAGVPLLAGTDTPNGCLSPGRSLHRELQMLVEAGLTPWEALAAATRNPARYLGRADEGAIARGKAANLVLLDADPLANIANTVRINRVMLRGRWHNGPPPAAEAAGRAH